MLSNRFNFASRTLFAAFALASSLLASPLTAQTPNAVTPKVVLGTADINLFAGDGQYTYSGDGGQATLAALVNPHGVAFYNGNLYIADSQNGVIREVNASGIISTFAGDNALANSYCGDNGPAKSACLNYPIDVVFDSLGNLYIADFDNNRIRKVAAGTGTITTYAGTGTSGYSGDGGLATEAELSGPDGLAMDTANNLYISDYKNNVVREVIASSGIINTIAGNNKAGYSGNGGPAINAELDGPVGLYFNKANNSLYIADSLNYTLRVVNSSKIISAFAGTGTQGGFTPGASGCNSGQATAVNLSTVSDIQFDTSGNAYFSNTFEYGYPYGWSEICKVDTTGALSVVAGISALGYAGDGAPADKATLNNPTFVTFDAAGNLYVADTSNYRIRKVTAQPAAASPTFTPTPGTYTATQSVIIGDTTTGAVIYYTTDGTTPTIDSTKYDGAITVSEDTTIKAFAVAANYTASPVVSAVYTITPPAATPVFSPVAGTYTTTQTVTVTASTPAAAIYCTTNGTTPTTASTKYSAAFTVATNETIECIATAPGYVTSAVETAKYVIAPVLPSPVFSPVAGTFTAAQTVTIKDSNTAAAIYYTTNGTTPTTSSTKYTAPITVSASETLKAIAVETGYTNSAVASASYVIDTVTATPVISLPANSYVGPQTVTVTDATAGAVIYCTTNGTTPTTASPKYTGPITVATSETLECVAIAPGHTISAVASAKYVIESIAATPVFSPNAGGTYESIQSITITDTTPGAVIYYTTNGTAPTTASTKYIAPVMVSATETIKAFAVATGYGNSATTSATYTIVGSPSALAAPATAITATGATLNSEVNTLGLAGAYYFQYGTSSTALTSTTAKTALTAVTTPAAASAKLTTLAAKTTYYYQVVVTTAGGTSSSAILSFTTATTAASSPKQTAE